MKPAYYFNECWSQGYYFFIGWSKESFSAVLKKEFGIECELGAGATLLIGGNTIIIWTQDLPKDATSHAVLAHECLHACNKTLYVRGYKLDLFNDEAQAYLFDTIYRQSLKSLKLTKKSK
jgi:hypothetical protein